MSCLLLWASVCLIDPSNIYLTGGLEAPLNHPSNERIAEPCYGADTWCLSKPNGGAVGTLRLGNVIEVSSEFTIDYGFAHRSLINTNKDRGQEFAYISVTYRPFRR